MCRALVCLSRSMWDPQVCRPVRGPRAHFWLRLGREGTLIVKAKRVSLHLDVTTWCTWFWGRARAVSSCWMTSHLFVFLMGGHFARLMLTWNWCGPYGFWTSHSLVFHFPKILKELPRKLPGGIHPITFVSARYTCVCLKNESWLLSVIFSE